MPTGSRLKKRLPHSVALRTYFGRPRPHCLASYAPLLAELRFTRVPTAPLIMSREVAPLGAVQTALWNPKVQHPASSFNPFRRPLNTGQELGCTWNPLQRNSSNCFGDKIIHQSELEVRGG
jgi:hypothetical protein